MLVCSASECHLQYVTLAAWNCHRRKWKLEIGKQYKSGWFWFWQMVVFSSLQLLSCFRLFVIPWTSAYQASLSINNPQSMLKLMFIKLVMLSNHLILCCPLLLSPSIFPSIRVFSSESALCIRWPKYWSFSFNMSFQWIFKTDFLQYWLVWFPCSPRDSRGSSLVPQFKSINSLAFSLLYGPTLKHPCMTTGKTIALILRPLLAKVMFLLFSTLSRFVRAFFPRSKHLLISWL